MHEMRRVWCKRLGGGDILRSVLDPLHSEFELQTLGDASNVDDILRNDLNRQTF